MTHFVVNRIDDRLPMGTDLVDILVEVENPSERLLRRRDVVAAGAEHHDRCADVPKIYGGAVRRLDPSGGEIVADEQLVDDELHFLGIENDVTAPPALEIQIARSLAVDFGVQIAGWNARRHRHELELAGSRRRLIFGQLAKPTEATGNSLTRHPGVFHLSLLGLDLEDSWR
jgi:hypothetical protein